MMRILLPSVSVLLTAGGVLGQEWFQRSSPAAPPGRQQHAVAFDAARGETVIFGGNQLFGPTLGDTWAWNGTTWSQRSVAGPSPRNDHAMANDPQRQVVVLFGGAVGQTIYQDTWEWNGSNWGARFTGTVPARRYSHGLAFDAAAGGILMFGGFVQPTVAGPETWVLNASNWTQLNPAASPPSGGELTMTTRNGRAVANFSAAAAGMQTWEFDRTSNRWIDLTAPFSVLSFGESISVASNDRLVLVIDKSIFGGAPQEVYELAGGSWNLRGTLSAPPSGRTIRTAFDTSRGVGVMFSGAPGYTDTWEFDNEARLATVQASGTGCGQPLTIAAATGSRPLIGGVFTSDLLGVPPAGPQVALGFSNATVGPFTLPLDLSFYGLTGCSLYHDLALILFGTVASTGTTTAQHTFTIVNARELLGVRFFLQAWAPDPNANPGGLVTSNLLTLGLGNY